jgi:hypothetical protein
MTGSWRGSFADNFRRCSTSALESGLRSLKAEVEPADRSRVGREAGALGPNEHEPEARSAALGFLDVDTAAVALGDLSDDRQAEAGSRLAARSF